MSDAVLDLEKYILRPTPEEIRDTRVLYFTGEHPMWGLEERYKIEALQRIGLNVTVLWDDTEAFVAAKDFDFIFHSLMPGTFAGRETLMPGLAAMRGIPFLGASGTVRAVSEDKVIGKGMALLHGIDVAKHRIINPRMPSLANMAQPGRWVFKPRYGTLSEYISFVDNPAAWRKAVQRSVHPMHGGEDFLIEEFVPGLNLAVPLVEGLPPESLVCYLEKADNEFNILTNSGKMGASRDYESDVYDGPGAAEAKAAATRFAEAISPFDYGRVDFRFEPVTGRLVFLEINMTCAVGPHSVVFKSVKRHGIDHDSLMGHIFTHSLRRQRKAA